MFYVLMSITFNIYDMSGYRESVLSKEPITISACRFELKRYQDTIIDGVRTMYLCRSVE